MCRRCSTTGRICEGPSYVSLHPWAAYKRGSTSSASDAASPPGLTVVSYSPSPLYSLASERERVIFHNFCSETSGRLSGLFNREFWTRSLPKAAQSHLALWHAGLAVSAMQIYRDSVRGVSSVDVQNEQYEFALTHFNRAIATMAGMIQGGLVGRGDLDVVLLTSVLFIAINNLLEDKEKSGQHARSALTLFDHWDFAGMARQRATDPTVIDTDALCIVYSQLAVTYDMEMSAPPPFAAMSEFHSVDDAWKEVQRFGMIYLRYHKARVMALASQEPRAGLLNSFEVMQRFDARFYEWRVRFARFRARAGDTSAEEVAGVRAMRLFCRFLNSLMNYPMMVRAPWRLAPQNPPVDDLKAALELNKSYLAQERAMTKGKGYIFIHNASVPNMMFYYGCIYRQPGPRDLWRSRMEKWPSDGVINMAGSIAAVDTALKDKENHGFERNPLRGGCVCEPPVIICHLHRARRLEVEMRGNSAARITVASLMEHEAELRGTVTEAEW